MSNAELIPIAGMITGILINLGMFAAIVLGIYYNVRARNKERMALIEKGVDISEIYKKKDNRLGFYKFGMIIIGIALGLIFAVVLAKFNVFPDLISYFIGVLLFGGLSILYANKEIEKKKQAELE